MSTKIRPEWLIILATILIIMVSWIVVRPRLRPEPIVKEPPKSYNQIAKFEQQIFETYDPGELFYPEEIIASHRYEDGHHFLAGSMKLPDSCMPIRLHVIKSEDELTRTLAFLIAPAPEERPENCESRYPKVADWTSSFPAPEDVEITAIANRREIPLTFKATVN